MNIYDYLEAGFKCFGLLGATDHDGSELPPEQKYKKPYSASWQHTPDWSDEQLETMEEMGQLDTGFGVLVDGYLVIDIDPRNGGFDSYAALGEDYEAQSKFVVATGGGGKHIYFKAPQGVALSYKLSHIPGIEFKSSGFVVGAGSLHASGNTYEPIKGHPCDIGEAPQSLVSLLKKEDRYRAKTSLGTIDVSEEDVEAMLAYIDPDCDYDTWVRIGMAINHTLNGHGFGLWDDWSKNGKKYPGYDKLQRHWHSFGKSNTPVTLGTVIHHAEQGGYQQSVSVEFETDLQEDEPETLDCSGVDLKRPPGFVGELTKWINSQCFFLRENLAVAAALSAVSSIGGLRYRDDVDGFTANLYTLCVAGSSTGKESIQQCYAECLRAAGVQAAMHGSIKSEQEMVRNLLRHQPAYYCIDEFGIVLRKIVNAGSKAGAAYLEGVIGLLMSVYSKANSYLPIGGDLKEFLMSELTKEAAACRKVIDNNEDRNGKAAERLEQVMFAIQHAASGIKEPYVNLIGFTTPVTFNELVSYEMATNGFISRAMIFDEPETNPKPNQKRAAQGMPDQLAAQLSALFKPGCYDMTQDGRIENYGEKSKISTDKNAQEALHAVSLHFWQLAEESKEKGLEAIPRRGYELVAKVSLVLSIPSGVRTIEHVRWAFKLVKSDIDRKMRLAYSNMEREESPLDSIAAKIQGILNDHQDGITHGVLVNRCRPAKKEAVEKVIAELVKKGLMEEQPAPRNSKKYTLTTPQ